MATPALRPRFLDPGDKLGKFELIRPLAIGEMAELYLARTLGLEGFETLVVVKRLLPQHAGTPHGVDRFLREARLAATLHHPNITQVHDIGIEAGEYFFSMEYVHGEDLGRLVAAAQDSGVPISLDCALALVAGLCAGLHYAHEKAGPDGKPLGVVHQDVSPSNVIVSYDGAVKLVDFGSALAAGPGDRRSDVLAIGSILYELTTGRAPFGADRIDTDAVPPSALVPDYPPALEVIVRKALARDVDQRYRTARELQGEIETFARENQLRITPIVLARLMSSLFPARLEEWDHARAQGAFFVEQHVVRTLVESGKTGDHAAVKPPDEEPTDLQAPPAIMLEDPEPALPPPASRPTPLPAVRPAPFPRAPARPSRDDTVFVRPPRSKLPLVLGLGLAVVAAGLAIVVIGTGSRDAPPATVVTEPPPAPPPAAAVVPASAPPAAEPAADPPAPPAPPAIARVAPKPKPAIGKSGPRKAAPKPLAVAKAPAKKPVAKPKPDPAWNAESPFMPVRAEKDRR